MRRASSERTPSKRRRRRSGAKEVPARRRVRRQSRQCWWEWMADGCAVGSSEEIWKAKWQWSDRREKICRWLRGRPRFPGAIEDAEKRPGNGIGRVEGRALATFGLAL